MANPRDVDPSGTDRPVSEARAAGRIAGEHGLESVPAETRRPLVVPLLGGAVVLAVLGWLILGPTADTPPARSSAEAPAAQPPSTYRAPASPAQR